ncbi:MAG: SDR family NAD(P)-dependent oxidoreductase [Acidimicrobiales bacterium]|nr:SDR family NAD(P)-dependent oxidoreductase [Acidimicrobiales bacterium]
MSASFTDRDVPDQSGRTALVTGANTGLGYETAKVLAARGARVLLACRTETKALEAMARIEAEVPNADLVFVPLDLGDLSSVRALVPLVEKEDRLDLLINNAGIMMPPYGVTVDGFETQFGVNHLGHFALTGLLLPLLDAGSNGRVVTVSSLAHTGGRIFWDDLQAEQKYGATARYGQSKLANLLFMRELDRRLRAADSSTISVGCHPGIADTELSRYFPKPLMLFAPLTRGFFNTAAQGAWPTLMAATAPDVEGGQYFGPSKRRQTAGPARRVGSSARSKDRDLARRLWDVSIELTGVDPGLDV